MDFPINKFQMVKISGGIRPVLAAPPAGGAGSLAVRVHPRNDGCKTALHAGRLQNRGIAGFPLSRRAVRGKSCLQSRNVVLRRKQSKVVLRGLDPRIHVLPSGAGRRGWPGQARPRRLYIGRRGIETRLACKQIFPGQPCAKAGTQGAGLRLEQGGVRSQQPVVEVPPWRIAAFDQLRLPGRRRFLTCSSRSIASLMVWWRFDEHQRAPAVVPLKAGGVLTRTLFEHSATDGPGSPLSRRVVRENFGLRSVSVWY